MLALIYCEFTTTAFFHDSKLGYNRKHAGYQCHDLKETISLLHPSKMKQSTMKRFLPSSGPILEGILK